MAGRPSKLTPELQAQIVGLVEAGNLNDTAAEACGVDRATFYNWMRWGQHGKQEGKGNSYVEFFDSVTRARAQAEVDLLAEARGGDDAGTSNGRAKCAQWTLERTRGVKYAPRVQVKVEEMADLLIEDIDAACAGKDCGCREAIVERVARRARGEEIAELASSEAGIH